MVWWQPLYMLFWAVLVCGGIAAAARPKGLLELSRLRIEFLYEQGRLPKGIAYPLIICETCMASFWGTLVFLLLRPLLDIPWSWSLLGWWPLLVVATACGNFILWACLHTLHKLIRKLDFEHGNARRDQGGHSATVQGADPQ